MQANEKTLTFFSKHFDPATRVYDWHKDLLNIYKNIFYYI